MEFIKKNIVFCVVSLLCLVASGAGAFLALSASGEVAKSERRVKNAQARLDSLLFASPSPTSANVEASEENIASLVSEMASIREDLQRGAAIETSANGVAVMAGIQQFISDHQRMVEENTDEAGNAAPILVKENFGFGFDRYLDNATPFESDEANETLDKQRQILAYLLECLVASGPDTIEAVERESRELASQEPAARTKSFEIEPEISARVENAIDTMAFSLTFTGYTDSLRGFLNKLAEFEMPIVVRSIEVDRPQESSTTEALPAANSGFDAIFGAFGGENSSSEETPAQAQQPVITDNVSKFTVIVEFIEIVLPEEADEELS